MNAIILYLFSFIEPSVLFSMCIQAVRDNSTVAFVPYFNDCLTERMRASIFSLFISLRSFLYMLCFILRYYQTKRFLKHPYYRLFLQLSSKQRRRAIYWNVVSLRLMIVNNIAMLGVTSFRVNHHFLLHFFFSFSTFVLTIGGFCIETWLAFQLSPHIVLSYVGKTRLFLTALMTILLLFTVVFTFWSYLLFTGKNFREERLFWRSNQEGYTQHVIAALCQWIFMLLVVPFMWTYVRGFSKVKFKADIYLEIQSAVDQNKNIIFKSIDSDDTED